MNRYKFILILILLITVIFIGCQIEDVDDISDEEIIILGKVTPAPISVKKSINTLNHKSIVYMGAFRMPEDGDSEENMFSWSGEAICYNPGTTDETGSLFVTGHNWHTYVAEISIPEAVISKDIETLPRAEIIQPLTNIRGKIYDRWDFEIPRVGLEVLNNKLYFSWGAHYQEDKIMGTHGSISTNLSQPNSGKASVIGDYNYSTNDYMFKIPTSWSDSIIPGYDMATGRFRDGGWSGMGPSLFAIKSIDIDNATMDVKIDALPLIYYSDSYEGDEGNTMDNYSHADSWSGGAVISSEKGGAVLFAGTHGFGNTWYGFANGVVWPTDGDDDQDYPEVPEYPYDQRGWWNDNFRPTIILYAPSDIARVVSGDRKSDEIQPYSAIDLSDYMIGVKDVTIMQYLGGTAYDDVNNKLYIQELFADGDTPVIHVFSIK